MSYIKINCTWIHATSQSGWKNLFEWIATMMYTLNLAVILSLVGHLEEAFSQGIKSDSVLLKTPYTFPNNASICERAEWSKSLPTKATIATYQNQIFRIEEGFHGEFTWKENHLLLNSAKYTDQGLYVFICNGVESSLKLDVLYALNVHAAEMDNIILNCHAGNVNDVTWLHNNEIVLHYKKDGSINPGKGYEGRVSLEKNCFKTGDFSLTITGVRKTDAGIYRCFVADETIKGYPHTYYLSHVNESRRSSPEDQTDSNCLTLHKTRLTIVFVIISCILILVVILVVLYCQYTSTSATATYRVPKSGENDCVSNTTSSKNDSQSMVNHPVQESDTTENKPSNTKPF